MDLKDAKELLKFVIEMVEAVDKSLVDKKLDMADLGNFLLALQSAGPALADVDKALAFFKAPTVEGLAELNDFIAQELQLTNEKTEKVAEQVIKVVFGLLEALVLLKQVKAPQA